MTMDQQAYEVYLNKAQEYDEGLCKRCGACCGVTENDPCEHLIEVSGRRYFCSIYENRLGIHKTIHGNEFRCVPLRNIIFGYWQGAGNCGYRRRLRKA